MKRYVPCGLLALSLSGFLAASQSAAQTLSDPGSLDRTVPTQPVEVPAAGPAITAPTQAPQSASPVSGSFVLGAVIIDGATVFDPTTLAQDFEPLLASRVGNAELLSIADRITQRYRAAGYPFSYAMLPEQDVRSGIVQIRVVEGFIGDVSIEGAGRSTGALEALAKPLLRDRPLRTGTLERVLGLMRDVPGVTIGDIQISRSATDPARLVMTIVAAHHQARALVYSDNRGTFNGARVRFYSSATLASLVTSGDKVKVDLFAVPGDNYHLLYGQLDASTPIGSEGLQLGATLSLSDYGQPLAGQQYAGFSRNLSAYVTYPLSRTRTSSVTGRLSLNDWKSEADLGGLLAQRDRMQVARISVQLKSWKSTSVDGQFTISKGVDLGSATDIGDPLASRSDASSQFIKLSFDIQTASPLSDRVTLRFGAAGQYSSHPLLSIEEFALGGARFGRAFDYNSLTGDHGLGGSVELGYRFGNVGQSLRQLEVFGSVDGGTVFRINPSAGRPPEDSLIGASGGLRFALGGVNSSLELGVPLMGRPDQEKFRAFFTLAKQF